MPTRSTPLVLPAATKRSTPSVSPQLQIVRWRFDSRDALEHSLLDFDPDEDIAALIAMPRTIPERVRAEITRAVGTRFDTASNMERWLETAHDALGGDAPFDRLIDGDGLGVLRALAADAGATVAAELLDLQPTMLRLVP